MPFVEWPQRALGFTIKKRLGLPNMFGWLIPGWSQFGDDNIFTGVYQTRHRRLDYWTAGYTPKGPRADFRMRPAWPIQPASAARDAQQAKFVTALGMWQALTTEQKKYYNKIASRKSKRGYDYFMSITLKSL